MPLCRFMKLMLVAPVDYLAGGNYLRVIDCLCVCGFCFDVFCDMDYWSPRQIKWSVELQH